VSDRLEAARFYTKKGWVIHPLSNPNDKAKSPGKRPLLSAWEKRGVATDEELIAWFEKGDSNVGLVLGKKSDSIVIDLDKLDWVDVIFPPEQKILENTLRAGRISGRGHVYFKFTDKIKNCKLHDFGIEVLSEGTQVVIPPSMHKEGQQYRWQLPEGKTIETVEISGMPATTIENIKLLQSLEGKVKACRTCFRWVINQSKDPMHDDQGRRLMLATATEMKAEEVTLNEFRLYARKIYGDGYDSVRTSEEWKNVDKNKRWRCETIRENFPDLAKLCDNCPKKALDADYIDMEIVNKAKEVMSTGDPINFILNTWNKFHAGDRPLGYILMCSAVSSSIENSDGLPVNFNGDSGGGKSHACRSMLHLIPKKWWIRRSLSNKAIFYSNSIKSDMIFFSDDTQMSDDFKMIFKNSVSDFQEQIEHETVNIQRKSELLKAPPRLSWWLTSVTDIGNEEVERRCVKINVEVTPQRKKVIADRLQKRRQVAEAKYPDDYPEVKVCRAIFKELKSKREKVVWNFNIHFRDDISLDTQNIIFELLIATALFNKYKRERTEDGAIIATREDFKNVSEAFAAISDTQVSKMTKAEIMVARYLGQVKEASGNAIQEYFGKSRSWVTQIMNGKNGDGGLLAKNSHIILEDVTTKDETESIRKQVYRFVGEWNEFEYYDVVATIDDPREEAKG
jgi:hypothetical protein